MRASAPLPEDLSALFFACILSSHWLALCRTAGPPQHFLLTWPAPTTNGPISFSIVERTCSKQFSSLPV